VTGVRRRAFVGATAAAIIGALGLGTLPGIAVAGVGQPGSVSSTPASGTPALASTGTTEQVRQLVQCGNTVYAVGTFSEISQAGQTFARNNAFSFSAVAPYTMTSWNPDVNGIVNSVAFDGTNCSNAFIGGKFTSVDGTSVKNIAEVSTTTGAVETAFRHSANGQVETLLGAEGHILVGGYYTSINSSGTDAYMTSLNPTTGKDDGFIRLNISGNYEFPGVESNPTRVYNQALSPSGTLDLVMGDFTSVGGVARQQIFMLNLATDPATVTGWTSPQWDGSQGESSPNGGPGYPYECATNEPFYIRAAAWSPNGQTVYIADTGYYPYGYSNGQTPRVGLCDAAAAFPSTQASVLDDWINYTGCDSLYAAAADSSTAYFAGHERWSENASGCDAAGPGAIPAPGFEGLSPTNGDLTFNPTRARGLGADDLLLTKAGLWIASDNLDDSQMCGGVNGHAGICFLPN
jgi:hypothetical protein